MCRKAVFCYGNNMYSTLVPRTARCTGSCRTTRFRLYREAIWMTEPLLSAAPVAVEPWLVLRVQELDGWMTHANRTPWLVLRVQDLIIHFIVHACAYRSRRPSTNSSRTRLPGQRSPVRRPDRSCAVRQYIPESTEGEAVLPGAGGRA